LKSNKEDNKKATYYKEVGGHTGALKVSGRWIGFNRSEYYNLLKQGMLNGQRWQGPPSQAIIKALKRET